MTEKVLTNKMLSYGVHKGIDKCEQGRAENYEAEEELEVPGVRTGSIMAHTHVQCVLNA